ncbi:Bifunctional NAD(P)H-hydrate repair enzyme Nnr [Roseivivax jejudonensis]|uniref:Bifunctional NAD(P)H-hydrate repair enzyme n=1 Tax=Roseivivax jejudonensis TaxID=1529041 RepID=A0A1X6YSR0_9RHOB|nr:NAD(P)H-hydrate dehydratase [Roseivivax jejudonensis]SLN30162.1 Bifunctional NAD(P)H-hydrate repair enzyme Nnr [Roseivivax jejudonensis]
MELLTAAEMSAAERTDIEAGRVTGAELMARAGAGTVDAVLAKWPDLAAGAHRAVVLCGPGNNGGDGFVVARLLAARGWTIDLYLLGRADALPPDARANHDLWRERGEVRALEDAAIAPPAVDGEVLWIDALFGTGLSRPFTLSAVARQLGAAARDPETRVVAIDMPSGWCSDSGRWLGDAAPEARTAADLTVTFHRRKAGHILSDGPTACGQLARVDIGLEAATAPGARPARLVEPDTLAAVSKRPGHKYDHGHALVLTGGAGRTGAARLSARAALRIGAGLVTLGVPGAAQLEVAMHETAVMLRRVDDAEALDTALEDPRLNSLCLGPGLGSERAHALVPAALASGRATVLDADALTAFADAPDRLFSKLHARCVLTPHMGEFARLFPDIAEDLKRTPESGPAASRIDAARAASVRCGAVVLLKGADTVIAAPDGRVLVNAAVYERSVPWLATAGAGDTLAGLIAGLLARGIAPLEAAGTGAWLHVECARRFGPGLIAEDLCGMLPGVLRELGV